MIKKFKTRLLDIHEVPSLKVDVPPGNPSTQDKHFSISGALKSEEDFYTYFNSDGEQVLLTLPPQAVALEQAVEMIGTKEVYNLCIEINAKHEEHIMNTLSYKTTSPQETANTELGYTIDFPFDRVFHWSYDDLKWIPVDFTDNK